MMTTCSGMGGVRSSKRSGQLSTTSGACRSAIGRGSLHGMELASLAQLERSHRRHDEVMAERLDAARRFAAGRPDDGDIQLVHEAIDYFARAVTPPFFSRAGEGWALLWRAGPAAPRARARPP